MHFTNANWSYRYTTQLWDRAPDLSTASALQQPSSWDELWSWGFRRCGLVSIFIHSTANLLVWFRLNTSFGALLVLLLLFILFILLEATVGSSLHQQTSSYEQFHSKSLYHLPSNTRSSMGLQHFSDTLKFWFAFWNSSICNRQGHIYHILNL